MNTPTISVNQVAAEELPDTATGVYWTDTAWTECRDHLQDPSWTAAVDQSDVPTGIVLTGNVECDMCREFGR